MSSAAYSILLNLVAAGIGWLAAVIFTALRRRWRQGQRVRAFRDFFGTSGQLLVIHSAVLDKPNDQGSAEYPVYNYPATDIRATRLLAGLFESVGLKEGLDYSILPDFKVKNNRELWNKDLVLLCGPARNHVFRDLNNELQMRYVMEIDQDGSNVLKDMQRGGQQMLTSRELKQVTNNENFDYGIIASLPNPKNSMRQLVILAGVHGTGTVGAAQFLTEDKGLLKLVKARRNQKNQVVCELVKAIYDDDIETPVSLPLV